MKFLKLTKLSIVNLLNPDDATNNGISGWQIKYVDNTGNINSNNITKLVFTEVKGAVLGDSYDFIIGSADLTVCETLDNNGNFIDTGLGSISLNDMHSNLPIASIGFDFCYLSVNELQYATVHPDISDFHVSMMSLDFLSSATGEIYNINDYTFKFECVKALPVINNDGTVSVVWTLGGSYTNTPLVLIPMPCPPVWRPGFSNQPHLRIFQQETTKQHLKEVAKQIKSIDKSKRN